VRGRARPVPSAARAGRGQAYLSVKVRVEWCAAVVMLVSAAPLLLVLAILVAVTSKGPVGYTQLRVGRSGRPFRMYKLRTMVHGCEARTGPVWAVPDDPRTTPVGRWLRDTHLDELPQLWNVVRGHMSLIGPRPERPEIAAEVERAMPEFRERLRVRPGITGLAQMRLPADSDLVTVRRKLDHDLYYIAHLGPSLDARIALSTPLRLAGDIALSMSRRIARPIAVPAVPPADLRQIQPWLGPRPPGGRGAAVDVDVRPAGRRAVAA
jgi:lipopolysaccharide/colanic/teichoic acid biosynthesis glycosyltransferase